MSLIQRILSAIEWALGINWERMPSYSYEEGIQVWKNKRTGEVKEIEKIL